MSIILFLFILLEAKCLQIDSNFIAKHLREKDGFEIFFQYHKLFSLITGLHLGCPLG